MFSMSSPTRHRRTVSGTDQVPMLVQAKLSRKRSLTDFVNRLSHPFRTHRVRTVTYSTNVQEYQFLQRIGQGATASVFAVMHEPSDTLLAVKTVNLEKLEMQHEPVLLESLRKEIQIMKLCRHPHVVPVLQSFVDTSHLFVVMPLMCSGSCRDLLLMLDHGLEEPLIACVTRQVILGLLYLHQNDLVHRDVKTANLLLDGDTGMVKLADFGVSSFLWIDQDEPDPSPPRTSNDSDWACFSSNTSTARIPLLQQQQQQQQLADSYQEDTVVGHQLRSDARQHRLSVRWQRAVRKSFVGTPLYIAPEILREEAYDNKVDMWALGITLLELAQGRPPYHEHDALTVFTMVLDQPSPKLNCDEASSIFQEFVDQCLIKDPMWRLSAEEAQQHPFLRRAPPSSFLQRFLAQYSQLDVRASLPRRQDIDPLPPVTQFHKRPAHYESGLNNIPWNFA